MDSVLPLLQNILCIPYSMKTLLLRLCFCYKWFFFHQSLFSSRIDNNFISFASAVLYNSTKFFCPE